MVGQRHYQFTALTFGLSSAPRIFTKCMAVVAVHLRHRGIQIYPYLDDWLIKGQSRVQVQHSFSIVRITWLRLGLLINKQIFTLIPA